MFRSTLKAALLSAAVAAPGSAMAIEEPSYRVVETHGEVEVREYAPHVVAAVEVEGERGEALNRGFRLLANYIFGNNRSRTKVAMTAPVAAQETKAAPVAAQETKVAPVAAQEAKAAQAEKLQMTAPVTGQPVDGNRWKVTFLMPSQYSLDSLPLPNDTRVHHEQVPARKVAALRFSGWATDGNVDRHLEALQGELGKLGMRTVGEPVLAQYDPPWSLPFWRRNEWLVEVEGGGAR